MLIDSLTGSANKPKALLNHYAAWKYVVLIVAVIVMALSALPTWFGEDAALQISSKAELSLDAQGIVTTLKQQGIAVKRLDATPEQTLLVLAQSSQQAAAKALLAQYAKNPQEFTLALSAAAPSWLLNLGFAPIKLGLDLRGGVQFLLDVDTAPVFHTQGEALADALRAEAANQGIRGVSIRQGNDETLLVAAPESGRSVLRQYLAKEYPQWVLSNDNDQWRIRLQDSEKLNLRNLTVQQNLQIMRSRIEELGITEALVQRQGENRIRIELPGVQDPAAAKQVIGATATLAFYEVLSERDPNGQQILDKSARPVSVARKPVLSGEHIVDARAGMGEMGMAEVNIVLDSEGGKRMAVFSREHVGKPMATAYSEYSAGKDGQAVQHNEIISVATIQTTLGSRFRITGVGSHQQAQQLALLLRAGSMTAPVTIVEERTIGPTLGAENIHNGFAALALGLAMTLLFMALWYRRLGWVANIALLANMVLLFGLLALIPGAVLTLPGIAGLVLTVGMAVDTNVLIFERIRDKLREGRSFAHAIDRGFDSAFSTIFDANFTTMITAVVLYAIGNGPIQGFALTLGLGLLTSMFTGIFASRAIINLVYGKNFSREVRV